MEDLDHLFLKCHLARAVWFGTKYTIRLEAIFPRLIRAWIASSLDCSSSATNNHLHITDSLTFLEDVLIT